MDVNPYAPPKAASGTETIRGAVKENHELRTLARTQLKGGWLAAAGLTLVYNIMVNGVHYIDLVMGWTIPGFFVQFIVGGPLTLGFMVYFLNNARGQPAQFWNLFEGFRQFGKSLLLYVLFVLFVTLWALLLVIPGFIKMFSYSMSYFILRDNPEIGPIEALAQSKKMMNGYKGKLFCLYASFIGWALLSVLTFGLGLLWLVPYMMQSMTNFYEDIKHNNA